MRHSQLKGLGGISRIVFRVVRAILARGNLLKRFNHCALLLAGVLAMEGGLRAGDLPVLTAGHTDVGVNFEDGAWDLHVHAEELELEYAPDAVWLQVGSEALTRVPTNAAFSFLGEAGAPIWVLPAVENHDLLFLGLGTEELAPGLFSNDTVTLTLKSVNGPGHFTLYHLDSFGNPVVFMNSRDGIDSADARTLTAGGHTHVNWGFSAPGQYRIGLQASGMLTATGETHTSEVAEYLFDVQAECHTFTQEHVDLLAIQFNAVSNRLSLMASDDDHGGALYASNQCVVLCPESMKFTLPAGTPLGNEGDPLWILPQNPYEGVPYVGVSAEALGPGSFQDPLMIRLLRVEGPGHFLVWQSTGFGSFDLKIDTRDGIGPNDQLTPLVGGHEHHNWGFTTSGVYRVWFQASGRRPGQTTNIVSPETPFAFHVLPLTPFENWTATNWPCECCSGIIAATADPDADHGVNAIEYALGTDPKAASPNRWPTASLVRTNGQTYGALTYTRAKAATDVSYEVIATSQLGLMKWQTLSHIHQVVDQDGIELVTARDDVPLSEHVTRFLQLRIKLSAPQ